MFHLFLFRELLWHSLKCIFIDDVNKEYKNVYFINSRGLKIQPWGTTRSMKLNRLLSHLGSLSLLKSKLGTFKNATNQKPHLTAYHWLNVAIGLNLKIIFKKNLKEGQDQNDLKIETLASYLKSSGKVQMSNTTKIPSSFMGYLNFLTLRTYFVYK